MAQSLARTTRHFSTRLFSTTTVLRRPSPSLSTLLPLSHLTSTIRSASIPCQSYGPGNSNYSPMKSGINFFQMSNREEEVKKKIYNVSCERYFGFGCELDEQTANKPQESNKFTYYQKMGGNPMIQQISLNHASNVRFYSSLSRIIATPKTQPMEKVCCQSYHTDKPGKTSSETSIKATPTLLSPHLPIYAPQLTSTFSIFHRISMAALTTIVLSFYLLYLKMGLICLTFENFYQFFFYASKLSLISAEIAGLAAISFLGLSARPLFLKR